MTENGTRGTRNAELGGRNSGANAGCGCSAFRLPPSALCWSHARPSHRLEPVRRRADRRPARAARGEDRARSGEWGGGGGRDPHAAAARRAAHRDRGGDGPRLGATRPTAVNLRWALDRMTRVATETPDDWGGSGVWERLQAEATAIWEEDRAMCRQIGEAGLPLIPDGAKVLTHCN